MRVSTKALVIAVDVLILCILITAAFMQYNAVSRVAYSEAESLNELNQEFDISSLKTLEGVNLSGATVVSAIHKYLSDMKVTINRNSPAQGLELQKGALFANFDETSDTYIADDTVFTCKVEYNTNGTPIEIKFTERGPITGNIPDGDIDIDDLKLNITNAMQGSISGSASWGSIVNLLSQEFDPSYKNNLITALKEGHDPSQGDSWKTLATESVNYISNLTTQLEQAQGAADAAQYKHDTQQPNADVASNPSDSVPIGFQPSMLIAEVQVNQQHFTFIYHKSNDMANGVWMNVSTNANNDFGNKLSIVNITDVDGNDNYYLLNETGYPVVFDAFKYNAN